jgi:hypothetical protein
MIFKEHFCWRTFLRWFDGIILRISFLTNIGCNKVYWVLELLPSCFCQHINIFFHLDLGQFLKIFPVINNFLKLIQNLAIGTRMWDIIKYKQEHRISLTLLFLILFILFINMGHIYNRRTLLLITYFLTH